MVCVSFSCFYTQYFVVFGALLILANISSCFGDLVSTIGTLLILSSVSWIITKCARERMDKELISSFKKAVLITGCDSGFGNRLAMKLNEHGFRVYATVLDPSGAGSQNLITNARFMDKTKVLKMDVTNEEEIRKTYEQIENDLNNNGEQLWAIVNNAGIASSGLIDWGTLETYKKIFDVNTFGTVRVTRTFLPLIKKSRGRIVNVVSLAGRLTHPMFTSYCMSKHAVLSFSDALRREMHKWGVKVSTIEPSFYKTPMTSKDTFLQTFGEEWTSTPESVKQVYGQQYFENMKNKCEEVTGPIGDNIDEVIDKMIDAIRSKVPNINYKPVSTFRSTILKTLALYLPSEWLDQMFYLKEKKMPKPSQLNA